MAEKQSNSTREAEVVDREEYSFGAYLRSVRRAKNVSIRSLAKAVNRTPTYLSDIENGYNRPPDQKLLEEIVGVLRLQGEPELLERLYDLAAVGRGDIPADVKSFLYQNPDVIPVIRKIKNAPDGDVLQQQILAHCRSVLL